jgi:hypothetical protein
MLMKPRNWLIAFGICILTALTAIGGLVIYLDPFFHYHGPVEGWCYELSDQRSQNDGITRHFTYDAIITGTSMTENFRTTEFNEIFGTEDCIKLPYPGATFKEINDNLKVAFSTDNEIVYVLRPLDYSHLVEDKDAMREDMGEYPSYLYDSNLLNDVKYLFNKDVLLYYLLPMLQKRLQGREGSITSFDDYGNSRQDACSRELALEGIDSFGTAAEQVGLTEEEIQTLRENMEQNVISLAKEHPDTTFLYYFPPYSAVWWGSLKADGTLPRQVQAEQIAAEMMLEETDNIQVYSFNLDETEVIFNLDNYKDSGHYSSDVNSMILTWIAEGVGRITEENEESFYRREEEYYLEYDYNQLLTPAE